MDILRRDMLKLPGAAALLAAVPVAANCAPSPYGNLDGSWDAVRSLFALSQERVHMSAMLLAAHPAPVREAIERHRQALDADTVAYLEENNDRLTQAARAAAGEYLGVDASHIALTDSTTMGVGLIYGGFAIGPGEEILTTDEDYYVTHESLRLAALKTGASVRRIDLFEDIATVGEDEIVSRIAEALRPETRLVALTWVHSSTGLKLPVAAIAAALDEANAGRDEADHVLLGIDGVHGYGIENTSLSELGCDFLMAGCHKWLFGPRGTGMVAIGDRGLERVRPGIPSFTDDTVFAAWLEDRDEPAGANSGPRMTPGGFKAFEHRWALTQAYEIHQAIGRQRIAERTHELAGMLKDALAEISGVTVVTPRSDALSAGIVSFDVDGSNPGQTVSRLRDRGIVASVAPYATPHVRLTPSIRNTQAEIEHVAAAMQEMV